jgi:hypothetical protein
VVQTQRSATMRALQEYTRLKRVDAELPWRLVLDAMIFQSEAELRWLDHCESSLIRYRPPAGTKPTSTTMLAHTDEVSHERA